MAELVSSIGTYRIWTSIIVLPLLMILLIALMVFFSSYQKGWVQAKATCATGPPCCDMTTGQCEVTIEGKPRTIYVTSPEERTQGAWPVTWDPKDEMSTPTTGVITKEGRMLIEFGLALILVAMLVNWCINIAFRNNETWKNVSGAMQMTSWASDVAAGFRPTS